MANGKDVGGTGKDGKVETMERDRKKGMKERESEKKEKEMGGKKEREVIYYSPRRVKKGRERQATWERWSGKFVTKRKIERRRKKET